MPDPSVRPGARLGEYLLVERIGAGGFGEVWVAKHAELEGRTVAIKIPADRSSARELRAEAFLQSALLHPNIVRTIGFSTQGETAYFVMEFVEGISLRDLLRRKKRLGAAHAARIAAEVLEALDFAHARGVVHRDIKPGNILCGVDGRVRVTDFGLSHVADTSLGSKSPATKTGPRLVPGTALYMAPEQRRALPPDPRSDLFSLGVVLFEMLTGELPTGCDLPGEVAPRVPPELDAVVKRALKADPAKRYPTAAAMRADLAQYIGGAPAAGTPSRPRLLLPAAAVAVAALVILVPALRRGLRGPGNAVRASVMESGNAVTGPLAGRVTLKTLPPGADAVVDGKNFGPTPVSIDALPAGAHVVVFRLPYHEELSVELSVGEGESAAPLYRLERQLGGLLLVTDPPGATVYVDGRAYGKAEPTFDWRNLPAGTHHVRVELAGYRPWEADLEVPGNRVLERTIELREER
jgi:hypothetical protein